MRAPAAWITDPPTAATSTLDGPFDYYVPTESHGALFDGSCDPNRMTHAKDRTVGRTSDFNRRVFRAASSLGTDKTDHQQPETKQQDGFENRSNFR